MTEAQIVIGIMQNDERAWRHICRNMKPSFSSILRGLFSFGETADEDIEDIFQESCIILMQKVKAGGLELNNDGALFSYLVQIGKLTSCNLKRKRAVAPKSEDDFSNVIPFLSMRGKQIPDIRKEMETEPGEISLSEKQQTQDEFLDRVLDSIPETCKTLLKKFYWDHTPMDEIASMLGLRNADTAKTKKNRCMNQFKDIAKRLLESDEFVEETVRACIERAALRELLEEERVLMSDSSIRKAALDIDESKDNPEEE